MRMKYTPKMIRWLEKNIPGKKYKDVTPVFNARFNADLNIQALKNVCHWYGIYAGRKGGIAVPVGTEKVFDRRDGITYVKISDLPHRKIHKNQGTWKQKQNLVWEAANGPVPKNHRVIFADRDKTNFDIDNLLLVSKRELFYLCRDNLLTNNAELTRTNLAIVKNNFAVTDAVKRLAKNRFNYHCSTKYKLKRMGL